MVELVITMAILSVLWGLAGPALTSLIASVRLSAHTEAVLAGLHLSRSEAIRRNTRVAYCKSIDGETCHKAGGWEQGGIVFQDLNNNGEREPLETVIHHQQKLATGTRVKGNSTVADYVSYSPDGVSRHASSGAFQAGTITVCLQSMGPTQGQQIVVNSGGRPRVQKVQLEACA